MGFNEKEAALWWVVFVQIQTAKKRSYMSASIKKLATSIKNYKITQVILAFWLVLAYDLLEDRCMIDVIITKFFICILKWRKVLRINLDNILHDWEKDKNKKSIVEALNRYEKHSLVGKRMIKPFSLENGTEKILQQSAVERD